MKKLARTRYKNAVVWTGFGNPLRDTLTIEGKVVVEDDGDSVDNELDCGGRAILPAFIDGHSHPSIVAKSALGPDVTNCKSVEEVVETVSSWIRSNPHAKWAVGGSYDRSMAPGGQFQAAWLDRASKTVAIALHASDQHTIWANSAAIQQAKLPNELPKGVELDSSGNPTGMFYESEAKNLILREVPPFSDSLLTMSLEAQLKHMTSLGIVATLDAWGDQTTERLFESLQSEVHVERAIAIHPGSWKNLQGVRTAKFFIDGVLGARTALVSQPYVTEHSHGSAFWDFEELIDALRHFDDLGCRLHLHAIGDGGVQVVIDALIALGSTAHRATIAHAELLLDSQIESLAALQVFVCAQPLWARIDSLSVGALENLGSERSKLLYRHRDLLDEGGLLSFGSDWPVSSPEPLLGIYTAICRTEPGSNNPLNPAQAITLDEAIKAYTETPAQQLGLEKRGRLEPGFSADFVLLSGNPFADSGATLAQMFVDETVSGGQTLFTRR